MQIVANRLVCRDAFTHAIYAPVLGELLRPFRERGHKYDTIGYQQELRPLPAFSTHTTEVENLNLTSKDLILQVGHNMKEMSERVMVGQARIAHEGISLTR
jgi:hypothetical protein